MSLTYNHRTFTKAWYQVVLISRISNFWFGLFFFRIYVDLAVFQPYLDLEAGDNQPLKIQVVRQGTEPGPLAPQAKSLTTRPSLLHFEILRCTWSNR